MKLIIASKNQGKVKEISELLKDLDIKVQGASEAGVDDEIIEDGKTLEKNSLKKAKFITQKTNQWAAADDTGLFIKALNNAPGVHTARWSNGEDLVEFTLKKMKNIPVGKRRAYFETVAALTSPDGKSWIFSGKVEGVISLTPKGKLRPKLPYDLIFIPKGFDKTFSEMTDEEKNSISHRKIAFKKLEEFLKNNKKTLWN